MAKVIGIGGIFYKANNKESLLAWYKDVLGMDVSPWGGCIFNWSEKPDGMTTWTLSASDTKYYQPSTKEFMLNLVVEDLDGLLASLRSKGANVLERGEASEYGKFGYVLDPEGTLIELWEAPVSA